MGRGLRRAAFLRFRASEGGQLMNSNAVASLARGAGLYRRKAAAAAQDWLAGPSAPFLGLKHSEVASLRRVVSGAKTEEEVGLAIEAHLTALKRRRKGASHWDHPVEGELTLLTSLLAAIKNAANTACRGLGD